MNFDYRFDISIIIIPVDAIPNCIYFLQNFLINFFFVNLIMIAKIALGVFVGKRNLTYRMYTHFYKILWLLQFLLTL